MSVVEFREIFFTLAHEFDNGPL